jgi:uncharacterized protein YggE
MKLFMSIAIFIMVGSLLQTSQAQVQGNATRFQQVQKNDYQGGYGKEKRKFEEGYMDYLSEDITVTNNGTKVPSNVLGPAQLLNNKTLELTVRVLSNKAADRYVAIFNLTQIASTIEETNKLMKERAEGFKSALEGMGIASERIYIDVVTFIPLYEYEKDKKIFSNRNNEIPKGYELQQNIHIAYTKADQLRSIMTKAAEYEVFDLITVEYQVKDHEGVYSTMRERAMKNIAQQLKGYEEQLAIDLTKSDRSLAESKYVVYPSSRYSSYKAFANVSMGNINERSKTQDMYKPTTYYYDQLRAESFDIVIEPELLEPAVQFVYELRMRLILDSQQISKNNYFWLTPEGEKVYIEPNAKN